jgi:hypothetical protein
MKISSTAFIFMASAVLSTFSTTHATTEEEPILRRIVRSDFPEPQLESRNPLERKLFQYQSWLHHFDSCSGDQLLVSASGINIPANRVATSYPLYLSAQRDLQALKYRGNLRALPAQLVRIRIMRARLDDELLDLRTNLTAALSQLQEEIDAPKK